MTRLIVNKKIIRNARCLKYRITDADRFTVKPGLDVNSHLPFNLIYYSLFFNYSFGDFSVVPSLGDSALIPC